jgi:SPP1 gp7 family putative phage head morphogenesis protein
MAAANKLFFDAQLRHAIGVSRYSAGEAKRVLALLDKADAELTTFLQKNLSQKMDLQSRRYKALQADVRAMRAEVWKTLKGGNQAELLDLADIETKWAAKALGSAIPVEFNFASVDSATLKQLVTKTPFAGGTNAARTLDQWWTGLKAVDAQRIQEAIQLGMTLGESVEQMVARVRLVHDLTRANAAAVVRTSVNHASNRARESFFEANASIIEALRWTSTLDGRTTLICQARDGKLAPITPGVEVPEPRLEPPTARPPAHAGCRSLTVAILDANAIADQLPDRPFVRSAKTGKAREKDFRAEAKEKAGSAWKDMTDRQRANAVKREKRAWAAENIGQVPGATTYDEWLRGQSASFQDDVLGPGRGKLFRDGMKLDKFVAVDGRELTLKELRAEVISPQWTRELQTAWEATVTEVERKALYDWSYKWDSDIRRVQKGGTALDHPDGAVKLRINRMEEALKGAPAYDGQVSRGMALHPDEVKRLWEAPGYLNLTFTSSSINANTAKSFALLRATEMNQHYRRGAAFFQPLVLTVKQNRTGVLINKFCKEVDEMEVLLRPNARYRIVDRRLHAAGGEDQVFGGLEWRELILEEVL